YPNLFSTPLGSKMISYREVIKRLAADQHHRNLTSPWFSPGCPHCVDCGWAEVSLYLLLSLPCRKQSDIYKPIVLALTIRMNRQNKIGDPVFLIAVVLAYC